ncbi:MAG: hypothetical protein ABH873_03995 [Candidatus Firestonebacteria bacterium]
MTSSTIIAKKLGIEPRVLEKESIKTYLEKHLRYLESELYNIAVKYEVKNFEEFIKLINKGKIHEGDKDWEDYYKFENIQHKRDTIIKVLRSYE